MDPDGDADEKEAEEEEKEEEKTFKIGKAGLKKLGKMSDDLKGAELDLQTTEQVCESADVKGNIP
eukprot:148793-Pyramimonas_sp.AAC.1